jgi:acyl-CoA synthetase (AMP-forming)/AMP-acid ligase II
VCCSRVCRVHKLSRLPRRLEIMPAIPRNATGKILKTQLRQQFG